MSWGSFIGGLFGGFGGQGSSGGSSGGGVDWGRMFTGALEGWGSAQQSEDQLRLSAELQAEAAEQQARLERDTAAYTSAYAARLNDWSIDRDKDKKRAGTSNFKQFGNLSGYSAVSTPTAVSATPPRPQSLEELLTGNGNG